MVLFRYILLLFAVLILFPGKPCGAQQLPDSILSVVNSNLDDTVILRKLMEWDEVIYVSNPELDLTLNEKVISLTKERLKSANNIEHKRLLKSYLSRGLNNVGLVKMNRGDHAAAIINFRECLLINEELKDSVGKSNALGNIGLIYSASKEYDKAVEYCEQSMELDILLHDDHGVAANLNNLGIIYLDTRNFTKSLEYHRRSLEIRERIGDSLGVAYSLINVALALKNLKNHDAALRYNLRALPIVEQFNDKQALAGVCNNIGDLLEMQGQYPQALEYYQRAYKLAHEVNSLKEIKMSSFHLQRIYSKTGKLQLALDMMNEYIVIKDSLESEENARTIIQHEFKYEYEKQAAADSIQNIERQKVQDARFAEQDARAKQQRTIQIALTVGVLLLIGFSFFTYQRFRIIRKQKEVIEEQKKVVEKTHLELAEKNKEIVDSITYAKRIQQAILPDSNYFSNLFPKHFVLYKPKDIVAGDFYWVASSRNTVYAAAADCTGHGVPGALVSMVCNSALNRAVKEFNISEPGEILNKTRELVIQEFAKTSTEVKDGMDISLMALTRVGTDGQLSLQWAGANNPLWIIRNGEVLETKPDKQPIGAYSKPQPFTTHSINIQKEDVIYLMTDGYQDQFGGPNGKKFKASNLKTLLININDKPLQDQKQTLEETVVTWQNNTEQIDDICIIGIKV
jgi:serine phosphatase RsbU (regulator of sigma subunit)